MTTFGDRLRELRFKNAMSQKDLAQVSGLSVRAVQSFENGTRVRPEPDSLKALAQAFELSVADLVQGVQVAGPKRNNRPKGEVSLNASMNMLLSLREMKEFQPCELVFVGSRSGAAKRGFFLLRDGDPPLIIFYDDENNPNATRMIRQARSR